MSPAATFPDEKVGEFWDPESFKSNSALLAGDLNAPLPVVIKEKGNYRWCDDGTKYFDASGGPAVASVGYGDQRVIGALCYQLNNGVAVHSDMLFRSVPSEKLARKLCESTGGHMTRAYFTTSGR